MNAPGFTAKTRSKAPARSIGPPQTGCKRSRRGGHASTNLADGAVATVVVVLPAGDDQNLYDEKGQK